MSHPSAPVLSSNPHEGDTSLALATLIPYSRDGPTLPLIGDSSGARATTHTSSNTNKTYSGTEPPGPTNPDGISGSNGDENGNANPGKRKSTSDNEARIVKKAKTTDNAALYTPWVLLPPEVRDSVPRRLGSDWDWGTHCIPIVYTRNQNIKSALNRLKAYLAYSSMRESSIEVPMALRDDGAGASEGTVGSGVICISAQADATTKLVGILELAKRVVAENEIGKTSEEGNCKQVWYSYTSLSSCVQSGENKADGRTRQREKADVDMSDGDEEYFESRSRDTGGKEKKKKVPVLTVWVAKRRIEEFRRAFGEQSFEVLKSAEDDDG